jgi:hypothetical protein
MSGFFESVAARARGEASTIRPRLPSRFESADAGAELFELNIETTAAPRVPPDPAAPPAAASDSRPAIAQRGETTSPAAAPPAARVETVEVPARPVAPVPRAPRTPEAAPEIHAFAQPPPAVTRTSEVSSPATVPSAPLHSTETTARQGPRAAPPPDPAVEPMPVATFASRVEYALPVATARPAPAEPAPVRPPRAERRAAGLATPREETTVHVSIGRIEVRAPPAAPEPRRREPRASPVMTLEDYLQSRRGRR